MNGTDTILRSATYSDRSRLANLVHFGAYLHQHLDWKPALDWIGNKPYLLLEKKGEILAALACPPELKDVAWIRLFAVSPLINLNEAWNLLWKAAVQEFSEGCRIQIAAISMQDWFNAVLANSSFEEIDAVVVLLWEHMARIPNPSAKKIELRPMYYEDLETIAAIDHDAFDSIWKNSLESLQLAFQQSSIASVALYEGESVGYQFSTNSVMGGHLARLAVKKSMQGRGIGYFILHDLLKQFINRGVQRITVNTQNNNSTSLALYHKAGFKLTGETYRVYQNNIQNIERLYD
jgi:ribosomal protein S18 acetylase RimI-like enzyme